MCSSKKNHNSHGGHFRFRSPPPWNFHFRGACHTPPPPSPWNFCNFPSWVPPEKNISVKNAVTLYFYAKDYCFCDKERKRSFYIKEPVFRYCECTKL